MDEVSASINCKAKIQKYSICTYSGTNYGNPVMANQAEVSLWRNEFREIVLSVSNKTGKLSKVPQNFLLKDVKFFHKKVREGMLTVHVRDQNTQIYISNAPPTLLNEFVKLLFVKLDNMKGEKTVSDRERLISRGKNNGTEWNGVSPLTQDDITKVNNKRKNLQNTDKSKRKIPFSDQTNSMSKRKAITLTKWSFNEDQKRVVQAIRRGESVFFTGGAGTGKTFLLKHAIGNLPPKGTYLTATTGVAACHIGGVTLHNFAGVGKGKGTPKACLEIAQKRASTVKRWRSCDRLIIDEVSMVSAAFFDILDYVGRALRGNDKPFGGIQLILCGDFFQLPPVSKGGESAADKKMCFQSRSWHTCNLNIIELHQVYRQSDPKFIHMLRGIRVGKCSESTVEMLRATEGNQLGKEGIIATKLCTHRADVDETNTRLLNDLKSTPQIYRARDETPAYTSFINQLLPDTVSITLKVGAQVMLTKNVDQNRGLVNGTRGVVTGFSKDDDRLPIVKFLSGKSQEVGYERWVATVSPGFNVVRKQIPLKLAWAISVHKSQGMTIDCVELDLNRAFENGQAYVALSRVRSLADLRVLQFDKKCIKTNLQVVDFYRSIRRNRDCDEIFALGGF